MPMPERSVEVVGHRPAQLGQAEDHRAGAGQGAAAALGGVGVDAEEGHDTVTGELVDGATGPLDRAAHRLEVPVQEEHHVVREPALGEGRESPEVGEQDGHLLLGAGERPRAGEAVTRPGRAGPGSFTDTSPRAASGTPAGTPGGAPTRSSTRNSSALAGGMPSAPRTWTRHVEHRPRPPQTEAWGIRRRSGSPRGWGTRVTARILGLPV